MSIDQIKVNCFTLKKTRRRRYFAETLTDTDYVNYLALLANTETHTDSLLYSLDQTAGGIGRYVNENKKGYMCFKQAESATLKVASL